VSFMENSRIASLCFQQVRIFSRYGVICCTTLLCPLVASIGDAPRPRLRNPVSTAYLTRRSPKWSSHIRLHSVEFLFIAVGFLIAWLGHAPRWPLWAVYSLLTFLVIASLRGVGRFEDRGVMSSSWVRAGFNKPNAASLLSRCSELRSRDCWS
jgi:hypothetical protein